MKITTGTDGLCTSKQIVREDGRTEFEIYLKAKENGFPKAHILLEWNFPITDIAGMWHPTCGTNRTILPDWSRSHKSMTACSAPVTAFFSENDRNRYTIALSEAKKEVLINMGVHEEDGFMKCAVTINAGNLLPEEDYRVNLILDTRDIPYYQALHDIQKWWIDECDIKPCPVPDLAKDAMYSFWYSFHQKFTDEEIENECRRAKELGFKTIILDDGWQTDDTNRGYSFCGDWNPAPSKIKNMKAHVETVHKIGLKYMIWFSVPFVGPKSKIWNKFKEQILFFDTEMDAGVLDIRYPEVRNYLKNTYIHAAREWNLDGLKLDFIDEFYERENTPPYSKNMDFRCLQDALDCLLKETTQELRAFKPDFLIEFRQKYIGPNVRKYGNIFRVDDCPLSAVSNRVGIVDLRLLSGNTAIHSDMLMWHENESAEDAALQVISCLFGTIQFSVNLEKLTPSQKAMIKNYLAFMQEKKVLLQDTILEPKEPLNLYPQVRAADEREEIIALYSADRVVTLAEDLEKSTLVNGTKARKIYLKTTTPDYTVKNIDCKGRLIETTKLEGPGVFEVSIMPGGRLELEKI